MTDIDDLAASKATRRRRCLTVIGVIGLLLLLVCIIALVLALTVFKPKQPRTEVLSATLEGVSPRISFPVINFQLNITLNLKLLIKNPNHASFKHGAGKSFLLYRGKQVGEADIDPGLIPSKGSETLPSRLTIEVDALASDMQPLISDVLGGQIGLETRSRIPGRVTFLGIFKKHAIATSNCQFIFAVPSFRIQSQECKSQTKF